MVSRFDHNQDDIDAQWTGRDGRPPRRPMTRRMPSPLLGLSGDHVGVNFRQLPERDRVVVEAIKKSFGEYDFKEPSDTSGHAYLDIQRRQKTVFHATREVDGDTRPLSVSLIFLPEEPSVHCWRFYLHDPRKKTQMPNRKGTLDEIRAFAVDQFLIQFRVNRQLGFETLL